MPRKRKEDITVEPGKGLNLGPELINQLVPGTLDRATINEQLAALKKAIFERALGGELPSGLRQGRSEARGQHQPPQRHEPQAGDDRRRHARR